MKGSTGALPRHNGPLINLGGREFVLPPMSLLIRKQDANGRMAIAGGSTELDEEAVVTGVMLATLQRNYPDLTLQELESLASFPELLDAYLTLKEEEAKLMFELGKRAATGPLPGPVAP